MASACDDDIDKDMIKTIHNEGDDILEKQMRADNEEESAASVKEHRNREVALDIEYRDTGLHQNADEIMFNQMTNSKVKNPEDLFNLEKL